MQTRALETLVRIRDVRSFSRAAELQNMTLSALSMQMKALEAELNVALFDRSFRPPILTPLGQDVAAQATNVLAEVQSLTALCGGEQELSGQFKLGVISSVAVRMLPRFISRFSKIAPAAKFQLSTGLSEDLCAQVQLGQIDGAIVTRVAGAPNDLHFETLRREEMSWVQPLTHREKSLDELSKTLDFIHFRPSSGIGRLIDAHLKGSTYQPTRTVVLDDLEACMEFVKQGLGYTLLPSPDVRKWADHTVHISSERTQGLFRELALVTRKETLDKRWSAEILRQFKEL